jgi:outer membrane lipoprotein carrier protein
MKNLFKIVLGASLLAMSTQSFAGVDPKAKSILDELSKNTKSYSTISAEVLKVVTKENKTLENQTLKVKLKGKKYRLNIPGNLIVSNGEKVWSKNNESGEVSIKNPEPDADINPSNIFVMYEKGYSYSFVKTEKAGKNISHVIKLIPDDKKKMDSVFIYVDGSKKKIQKMKVFKKNKSVETYEIKTFVANAKIEESEFVYDTSKTPKDLIIDETDGK